MRTENEHLKVECTELEIENLDLLASEDECGDDSFRAETTFQDIIGHHKYTNEIRKLYYSLLADQIPVSKIGDVII